MRIFIPIAYAQELSLNMHNDVSSMNKGRNFCMSLHLHLYFVFASCEGSGESVHLHRLT